MVRTAPPSRLARAALTLGCAAVVLGHAGASAAQPPAKAAPLPPAPVSIRVIAPSPDPPWTIEVQNEGDRPIRIPADVRLLTFEIQRPGSRERVPCKPAPGQKPTRFPAARELVLAPGESWVETFDPRLFCFGRAGDLLRGGTLVRSRFGFDPRAFLAHKEPFAVQSLDAPATFAPARELALPTFLLSFPASELAPPDPTPAGASKANAPLERPAAPPAETAEAKGPSDEPTPANAAKPAPAEVRTPREIARDDDRERAREEERKRELEREADLARMYGEPKEPRRLRDRQAPDLDLYTNPWSDGSAPRDVVLHLHARNEGGRALAAVLRSRMLRFRVEGPLLADNKTTVTHECIVDERSHGVPVEMVRNYRPGDRLDIPFLLAEVCPRGTFDRPGLFRVTPVLTSAIQGEAVDHQDAFQGRVRALQPVLARIGSSRLPFYEKPAKATPAPPRVAEPIEDPGVPGSGTEGH